MAKDTTNPKIAATARRLGADPVPPHRASGNVNWGPALRPEGRPPSGSTPPGQPARRPLPGGSLPTEPNYNVRGGPE